MQNKEKYRFLVENIPDVVWTIDRNGNTTFVNSKVENVCGYTPQEIYAADDHFWLDRTHPGDVEKVKTACESLFKSNKMFDIEYRIKRKDGSWIWIHDRAITTYKKDGVTYADGVFTDITERKRLEKALRKERDTSQKYLDIAPVIFLILDSAGNVLLINKNGCELLGYPRREILGKNWIDNFTPQRNRDNIKTAFCNVTHSKINPFEYYETTILANKKGAERIIAWHSTLLEDENGNILGTLSSGVDITERKQAEDMLKESEQRFKSIFENAPDGMLVADTKTKGFYLGNEVICRMLGYKKEEIRHLRVMDIHSKEDLPYVIEQFEKQAKGEITLARNIPVKRKDGSIFYADINTILLPLDGKTYMMGLFRDITEQKHMEEEQAKLRDQLYHAQKLASVGKLAGGVAHNFNNLLTVVMGYASLLLAKLKEGDPLREYAQKVISSSQVAANLTQDLLAFSRQKPVNPQPVNMNEIIKDTEGILSRLIRENIKLKTALTKKDCIVMADSDQLKHVLMNLTTNAKDAMPNGGDLNICTDVVEIDKTFIKAHGFGKIGKYALISFSDTGMGMDENIRLRIFDPFFTTKEVGKGTGLGLAIVYGLVKQHNGYIDVDSSPGKGATFKIYLPQLTNNEELRKETP